jgi:hypothetical protein
MPEHGGFDCDDVADDPLDRMASPVDRRAYGCDDDLLVTELSPRTFWNLARESSSFTPGKGRLRESDADPGHGSAPGSVSEGGQLLVVMRQRRLTGTSRRPPIGSPQRGPGVRRPRA